MLYTSAGRGEGFILRHTLTNPKKAELNMGREILKMLTLEQRTQLEEMGQNKLPEAEMLEKMGQATLGKAYLLKAYRAILSELETQADRRTPGILLATKEHTRYLLSGGDRVI